MTTNLKKLLLSSSKEEINTNNSWGFGGWRGTRYSLTLGVLKFIYEVGRNHHRHTGTSSHTAFYASLVGEDRVIYSGNPLESEVVTCYKVLKQSENDPDLILIFGEGKITGVKIGDGTLTRTHPWGKTTYKVGMGTTMTIEELGSFQPLN